MNVELGNRQTDQEALFFEARWISGYAVSLANVVPALKLPAASPARAKGPHSMDSFLGSMLRKLQPVLPCVLSLTMAVPTGAQSLAEKGEILYRNRCVGCHGEELRAFAGGQAFDLRRLRPDEYERFVESVISGKDNMPSWYGILSNEEIQAIWAYIRATVDR
jgi:mono/diheme cytochrome c family protein